MSLSSNSIIHFTGKSKNLLGILEANFKVSLCRETIVFNKQATESVLVPMVSFCDIPLSQIKNHIHSYGPYGIGLKKSWAEKKGLSPVLYLEKESTLGDELYKGLESFIKIDSTNIKPLGLAIMKIVGYIKNYQGDLKRKVGTTKKNYRFSDEREWRYIPSVDLFPSPYIALKEYEKNKKVIDSKIGKLSLDFTPDDISYIIIKNDSEIKTFINLLRDTKGKKYTLEQIERLTTRILTTEQIMSDF